MGFLFGLFWSIDLLLFVFVLSAKGFRDEMSLSTGLHGWLLIALLLALLGGPLLRFAFRLRMASLLVAALPLLVMLLAYIFDKSRGV